MTAATMRFVLNGIVVFRTGANQGRLRPPRNCQTGSGLTGVKWPYMVVKGPIQV